jgi:ribosome biogenesis GTPase / thiamine phosphate phosphatase
LNKLGETSIESDDVGAAARGLRAYGWDGFFEEGFRALAREGECPARVVEERRGSYLIARAGDGGRITLEEARPAGALGRDAASASELPAVGDWVAARPGSDGPAMIRAVLPRRSAFMRKAPGETAHDRVDAQVVAANVDIALVVCAAGRDWSPRRIERYAALARAASVPCALVVSKADLIDDAAALLAEAELAAAGSPVVLACAPAGQGLAELAALLGEGRTAALLGSSGAGKSTLLNALAGEELAGVGEVREDDQRGRHTTTSRRLYRLPTGALVVDTPGMRELQLWAEEADVDSAFPEIEGLADRCRFRDCRHQGEPGCAVRGALEAGLVDAGRYEGWRKLQKEAAFLKAREETSASAAEKARWKGISKFQKSVAMEAKRRGGGR